MSQTLTIEVPDDVFKVLLEIAQQEAKTPAEMGTQWVALAAERIKNDPLEQFIGAFPSDVRDWADRHDAYLGEKLMKELSGAREEDAPDA